MVNMRKQSNIYMDFTKTVELELRLCSRVVHMHTITLYRTLGQFQSEIRASQLNATFKEFVDEIDVEIIQFCHFVFAPYEFFEISQ